VFVRRPAPEVLGVLGRAPAAAGARLLAIESGEGQAPAVAALMRDAGFADVQARRDLAGIERVVVGRR
jgi:release factor glutamine methyltransferase